MKNLVGISKKGCNEKQFATRRVNTILRQRNAIPMKYPVVFPLLFQFTQAIYTNYDGTLSYFNNKYRTTEAERERYQVYFRTDECPKRYTACLGLERLAVSKPMGSMNKAELSVVKTFLRKWGGEEEVLKAENYNRETEIVKQYVFGTCIREEEGQHLEFKSNRLVPQTQPVTLPFGAQSLQSHIRKHVGKYACAFLNGQFVHDGPRAASTILFGIHDDGDVDGHHLSSSEKDEIQRLVTFELNKLSNQSFLRKITWHKVYNTPIHNTYVLSVTVTPMYARMNLFALPTQAKGKGFVFWIRKSTLCQEMTYSEIEQAFHQIHSE